MHSDALGDLVLKLDCPGYQRDYSFAIFNDDHVNVPLPIVREHALKSTVWLAEDALRRSTPLPNNMRFKYAVPRG